MRHLHIDCNVGISGDMMLGALLDLGIAPDTLREALRGLGDDFVLEVGQVRKCGLAAADLRVELANGRHHSPEHDHDKYHHHGMSYAECRDRICAADFEPRALERSLAVLQVLGEAEAAAHGCLVEEIHFHELGGLDTLVDICGCAVALDMLEVGSVSAGPVPIAHGFIECAHGTMPVPPPAVAHIVQGLRVVPVDIAAETVTPTGAALIRALAETVGPMPAMRVERVGHGAGKLDLAPYPNILRLFLGERDTLAPAPVVWEIESQIDDCTPETIAHAAARLLEDGALDVFCYPVTMKKGRLGTAVTVLAAPGDTERLAYALMESTSSIGVRVHECRRLCLPREHRSVDTPYGPVSVKVVRLPDGTERAAPEYEDCARLAGEHQVQLQEIYTTALNAWRTSSGLR